MRYPPADCPAGTPSSVECFARTGSGLIRGLGNVSESYPYFLDNAAAGCAPGQVQALVPPNPVRGEETFTVTNGSGSYAGASGEGTITHEWFGANTASSTFTVTVRATPVAAGTARSPP